MEVLQLFAPVVDPLVPELLVMLEEFVEPSLELVANKSYVITFKTKNIIYQLVLQLTDQPHLSNSDWHFHTIVYYLDTDLIHNFNRFFNSIIMYL